MANYNGGIFVGHGTSEKDGSYDPGACASGKQEHVIAEKIVDKAVVLCTKKGLSIHRDEQNYKDDDIIGNSYSSKYVITVHLNAGGGKRCEVYVPCKDTWLNPDFYMVNELDKIGLANGGVRSRDYNTGNTYTRTNGVALYYTDYYKEINVARSHGISLSILEVGFIDSTDISIIEKNIDRIATIVANAMLMACGKELYPVNTTNNDTNKGDVKLMQEYIVQYSNPVDESVAQHIADRLYCPTINCDARPFKYYSHYKTVIAVGECKNKSSYTNVEIKGRDRRETMDKAIAWLKSIGR